MEFKDYYKIMGLARDASADEIKRAYRKLARKYHPDVSKEPDAERRFKEIGEAYEVLKDPEKRQAYDALGANYKAGQDFRPPPGWERSFSFGGADAGADFSEFFRSLFGDAGMGAGGGAGPFGRGSFRTRGGFGGARSPFDGPQGSAGARGQDARARVMIDLEDAYTGASRTITLRRGDGTERTLSVRIPKGIRPGQTIRLAGQGEAGPRGGERGDVLLDVEFRAHPRYTLQGTDVYVDVAMAPWDAALGTTVTVPLPTGSVELRVPGGSSSGRRLRLRGRGLPAATPGDLYAVVKVEMPPVRTAAQREAWEALRATYENESVKAAGGG